MSMPTQKFNTNITVPVPIIKRRNRCQSCGKAYYRRNQVELWTGRNIGYRSGWYKTVAKVCLECQPIEDCKRMLTYVDVSYKETRLSKIRR